MKVQRACNHCGKSVFRELSDLNSKNRIYCSRVCANTALIKYGDEQALCKLCGNAFIYRQTKRRQVAQYCSVECRDQGMKRPMHQKTCERCGGLFETRDKKRKFCGEDCLLDYRRRNLKILTCGVCSEPYETYRANQKYCSLACASTIPSRVGQTANNVKDFGNCYGLELVDNNGAVKGVALVDKDDYPSIQHLRWSLVDIGEKRLPSVTARYRNSGHYVTVYLHRLITQAPKGKHVDHINHNRLDNRRSNLRIATPSQNGFNRIPMRRELPTGIYFLSKAKSLPWLVHLSANRTLHHRRVASFDQAVALRAEWERAHHGSFAYKASLRQAPEPIPIAPTI